MEPGPRLVQALIRPGALVSWAVALALTGCATGPALVKAPPPEIPAPQPAPAPVPKVAPRPAETGTASWYGKAHHGQPTASGETYDMRAFTAAHRSLPLGTRVLVTNVQNARTVEVRINDRGPFVRRGVPGEAPRTRRGGGGACWLISAGEDGRGRARYAGHRAVER